MVDACVCVCECVCVWLLLLDLDGSRVHVGVRICLCGRMCTRACVCVKDACVYVRVRLCELACVRV